MSDEKLKELAKQIKILRAKNDLTQNDLAVKTGLGFSTIVCLENCKKIPRVETLVKIAEACNVDEELLLKYID